MITLGVDWSMTSPAWTYIDETGKFVHHYFLHRNRKNSGKDESIEHIMQTSESKMESFKPWLYPTYDTPQQRFYLLSEVLVDSVNAYNMFDMKVVFEGYSFGATGKVFDIAECTGIAKQALYREYGLIPTVVPSTQWKKHFGLKGNSDKKPIVDLYIERTGNDLYSLFNKKPDQKSLGVISDIADSYFIALYALEATTNDSN